MTSPDTTGGQGGATGPPDTEGRDMVQVATPGQSRHQTIEVVVTSGTCR